MDKKIKGSLFFLFLLVLSLSGCVNHDAFTSVYGGFNDQGGGTIGVRLGAYLESEHRVDGGFAIDTAAILGDDVDQVVVSPLFLARYQATQYLEPYLGAGPSLVFSDGYSDSSVDAGATILGGVSYQIIATKPWWAFLEVRGSYANGIELGERGGGGGMAVRAVSRGRGPPCFPDDTRDSCNPEPSPGPLPPSMRPNSVEDWSVNLVLGLSVRW